jgi:zinc transport system substrate-binding protein
MVFMPVVVRLRRARSLLAVPAALVAGVGLSGCAALGLDGGAAQGDGGSTGDVPTVAAAFYPLAFVAEQVAGDRAEVENLTTPGGEPHDLELGVGETARVAEADLVFYQEGFQPAVDAATDESVSGSVLDVTEVVQLRPVSGDHAGESEEQHAEHAGEQGDLDPHFWLDPLLMADLADAVAEELSAIDPEGADTYAANAAALRTDLEELDAAYARGLADCARDLVVVNHDAFGYLARYGLRFEPITGLSPDAEPTPGDLVRLQELIRGEGVTTVFSESLVSPETAETLAADLGIEAAVLDPVEGLTDATAQQDYLSLMRANLASLRTANGC